MLIKILINNTDSPIDLLSKEVAAGENIVVRFNRVFDVADDMQLQGPIYDRIISGDLIVNDGTINLNATDGVKHLQKIEDLSSIPNTGSMNIIFSRQGEVKNKYLSVGDKDLSSNDSTVGFPRDVKIVGYFFDAKDSLDESIKIIFREKTNLEVDKYSIIKQESEETKYDWNDAGLIEFSAGDRLSVYIKEVDKGKVKEPIITIWYRWAD